MCGACANMLPELASDVGVMNVVRSVFVICKRVIEMVITVSYSDAPWCCKAPVNYVVF